MKKGRLPETASFNQRFIMTQPHPAGLLAFFELLGVQQRMVGSAWERRFVLPQA